MASALAHATLIAGFPKVQGASGAPARILALL
jgi:kynurenine formamidase